MPPIRSPMHCNDLHHLGSFLGYSSSCSERGSLINLFPTHSDDFFSNSEDPALVGPLSQWIGPTPMLSELDVYERVTECSRGSHPPPAYNDHYLSGEDSSDANYSWSYDSTANSSPSGSPYPGFIAENGFVLSPTISVTTSSPASEPAVLTPPQEYAQSAFEYDYGPSYTSDARTSPSTWSTRHHSLSPSPSPSNDGRSSTSRDPSPSNERPEKPDRRRLPCLVLGCDRRFTSQYTLKVHMEAHKPKPKVTFPCTEGCSERFSRQHDRLRHEVAKHGKVCEFSCSDCHRFFGSKKTLGNHKCPVAMGGTRWVTG